MNGTKREAGNVMLAPCQGMAPSELILFRQAKVTVDTRRGSWNDFCNFSGWSEY